jgi:hypothetical protein
MFKSKAVYAGLGAALLASTFSFQAVADPNEALAACKTAIAEDARLGQYARLSQNTGEIKRRGRYTQFEIRVKGEDSNGESAVFVANCKARNSGAMETLELVQVSGTANNQVAQAGS